MSRYKGEKQVQSFFVALSFIAVRGICAFVEGVCVCVGVCVLLWGDVCMCVGVYVMFSHL